MREINIGYPNVSQPRILPHNFRTIHNKIKAWELGEEYYDGARENGYGGYRYDGRWAKIIPFLIKEYGLSNNSSVLDLGCKKGFFMNDLKEMLPGIKIRGVENHLYPIKSSMDSVREEIIYSPYENLPFGDGEFDFILAYASIYMLNLGGVIKVLREIQRVGKGKSYITLGAYRKEEDKELFLDWTLLGTTVLHVEEWLEVLKSVSYTGDYYFTSAESLKLVREE